MAVRREGGEGVAPTMILSAARVQPRSAAVMPLVIKLSTWGAGNNRAGSTRYGVQFPERAWQDGQVTISERIGAGRRERRVPARVSRAGWRLEQITRVTNRNEAFHGFAGC